MLQIKKQHSVIKGMTAGAIAFAIGLTGAAAFIGDEFQSDPQVFNREQQRDSESSSDGSSGNDPTKTDAKTQSSGAETARHFLDEGLVDRIALFRSDVEVGAEGIASPIDEEGIPAGFELKRQAVFDNDRYMEWARAG